MYTGEIKGRRIRKRDIYAAILSNVKTSETLSRTGFSRTMCYYSRYPPQSSMYSCLVKDISILKRTFTIINKYTCQMKQIKERLSYMFQKDQSMWRFIYLHRWKLILLITNKDWFRAEYERSGRPVLQIWSGRGVGVGRHGMKEEEYPRMNKEQKV